MVAQPPGLAVRIRNSGVKKRSSRKKFDKKIIVRSSSPVQSVHIISFFTCDEGHRTQRIVLFSCDNFRHFCFFTNIKCNFVLVVLLCTRPKNFTLVILSFLSLSRCMSSNRVCSCLCRGRGVKETARKGNEESSGRSALWAWWVEQRRGRGRKKTFADWTGPDIAASVIFFIVAE